MYKNIVKFTRKFSRYIHSPRRGFLQTMRIMSGSRQLVIIGSAHKVGSTWLYRLLLDLCDYDAYSLPKVVIKRHPQEQPVDIDLYSVLKEIRMPAGGYVYKSHSYPPDSVASELPTWTKFVTILRDPRDVIVSSCFYLAQLPENQGGWGESFRNFEEHKRIISIIENGAFLRLRLRRWNQYPYAHKVRYEVLLSDPIDELQRLLTFLGIRLGKARIRKICNKHSFKKQAGRNRGDEDKSAFLRKGIAGDWSNYFDEEVKKAFKYSCDGDWNDLLVELGYEENRDW